NPLLTFRCVSKSWLSLISSGEFIKIHLNLSANNENTQHMLFSEELNFGDKWIFKDFPLTSLFNDSVTHALDLDYPIENDTQCLYVLGSCNGLLFLSDEENDFSLLWNPTIRKHKKLPFFTPRFKAYHFKYGFGFDELHDDYKVLGIFNCGFELPNKPLLLECSFELLIPEPVSLWINCIDGDSDDVEVKVYSLKSDSWNSIDNYGDTLSCGSGSFVDGMLHWHTGRNIISFDLANEKWDKMEKPSYEVGETKLYLGKLGSDLCIFCDYNRTHLRVWVMKEYGVKESWIKMFNIKYPNDQSHLHPLLFMSNKGEMLFLIQSRFMIYNSKDELFRYLRLTNHEGNHGVEIYIESLVFPFSQLMGQRI
ncbi:F-box protein CPR1-like, partial [Solanum dulcamara]|uniref:F-box protein CPR1-like n=1 Tax=Solanum dulcamara TaxID=45834 RepID=UPI002486C651